MLQNVRLEHRSIENHQIYSVFPMMKGVQPRRAKTESSQKSKVFPVKKIGSDEQQFLLRMKKAKDLIFSHKKRKKQIKQQQSASMSLSYIEKMQKLKKCKHLPKNNFSQVIYTIGTNQKKIKQNISEQNERLRQCRSQFMRNNGRQVGKQKQEHSVREDRKDKHNDIGCNQSPKIITIEERIQQLPIEIKRKKKKFLFEQKSKSYQKNPQISPKLICKKVDLYLSLDGQEYEVVKQHTNIFPPFNSPKNKHSSHQIPYKNYKNLKKFKPLKYKAGIDEDDQVQIKQSNCTQQMQKKLNQVLKQKGKNQKLPQILQKQEKQVVIKHEVTFRKEEKELKDHATMNFVLKGWDMSDTFGNKFPCPQKDDFS